jgi:hypothetical protein
LARHRDISYGELFGEANIYSSGNATPLLVELCVQYERDVRLGETLLEQRLSDAARVTTKGRFESGVHEASLALTTWARSRNFAPELIFGAPVEELDADDRSVPCSPTVPLELALSKTDRSPRNSRAMRSSRSFGGNALEKALRGLSMAIPAGGIAAPETMAHAVLGALGREVAGRASARLQPNPVTGAMPAGQLRMRLVPDVPSMGFESQVPRVLVASRPSAAAAAAGSSPSDPSPGIGDDVADEADVSAKPLTAGDIFYAASRSLPLAGTFLLRVACGSYVVPPSVFYSSEAAYTRGINLAASLHYDVPRVTGKVPPPLTSGANAAAATGPQGRGAGAGAAPPSSPTKAKPKPK